MFTHGAYHKVLHVCLQVRESIFEWHALHHLKYLFICLTVNLQDSNSSFFFLYFIETVVSRSKLPATSY